MEGEPKCESAKGGGPSARITGQDMRSAGRTGPPLEEGDPVIGRKKWSGVKGRNAGTGKMKSHLRSVGDLHAPGLGDDMAKDGPVTARTDEEKENMWENPTGEALVRQTGTERRKEGIEKGDMKKPGPRRESVGENPNRDMTVEVTTGVSNMRIRDPDIPKMKHPGSIKGWLKNDNLFLGKR